MRFCVRYVQRNSNRQPAFGEKEGISEQKRLHLSMAGLQLRQGQLTITELQVSPPLLLASPVIPSPVLSLLRNVCVT
jgi:hypothetical protein